MNYKYILFEILHVVVSKTEEYDSNVILFIILKSILLPDRILFGRKHI